LPKCESGQAAIRYKLGYTIPIKFPKRRQKIKERGKASAGASERARDVREDSMKMRRRSMRRTPSDAIIATRSVLFHAWCVFFFSISRCARAQPASSSAQYDAPPPASTSETSTQLPERSGLVGVERGPRRTEYADGVF